MHGLTSPRPSAALACLALAAIAFQVALSLTAPGLAAWSPAHAHVSLDGRDHAHVHAWDGLTSGTGAARQATGRPQSEPAPSTDLGLAGAAIALPAALGLLAIAGVALAARPEAAPALRGIALVPVAPPPRG